MNRSKKTKKKKNSIFDIVKKLSVTVVLALLFVSFVGGKMRIAQKQKELDSVSLVLQEQKTRNAEIERLVEQGDEDAYIARYAREELGYIWPGERVFMDITGK